MCRHLKLGTSASAWDKFTCSWVGNSISLISQQLPMGTSALCFSCIMPIHSKGESLRQTCLIKEFFSLAQP